MTGTVSSAGVRVDANTNSPAQMLAIMKCFERITDSPMVAFFKFCTVCIFTPANLFIKLPSALTLLKSGLKEFAALKPSFISFELSRPNQVQGKGNKRAANDQNHSFKRVP
jgi:hypothetical protein